MAFIIHPKQINKYSNINKRHRRVINNQKTNNKPLAILPEEVFLLPRCSPSNLFPLPLLPLEKKRYLLLFSPASSPWFSLLTLLNPQFSFFFFFLCFSLPHGNSPWTPLCNLSSPCSLESSPSLQLSAASSKMEKHHLKSTPTSSSRPHL